MTIILSVCPSVATYEPFNNINMAETQNCRVVAIIAPFSLGA
jgi:hypothetical protein